MSNGLPAWASEMRDLFRAGSTAQFILHGNVFDVIPAGGKQHSLGSFLDEVMFETFDVVLHYDRGKGIRATKGAEDYGKWLHEFAGDEMRTLAVERRPGPALELLDRYLLRTLNLRAIGRGKVPGIAIVIDFAEFVVPRGDPLQLGGEFSGNLVKMLSWANDPSILEANIAVVLVTEGLQNLDELVVENPHTAKLKIPLPGEEEMLDYLNTLAAGPIKDLAARSEVQQAGCSAAFLGRAPGRVRLPKCRVPTGCSKKRLPIIAIWKTVPRFTRRVRWHEPPHRPRMCCGRNAFTRTTARVATKPLTRCACHRLRRTSASARRSRPETSNISARD